MPRPTFIDEHVPDLINVEIDHLKIPRIPRTICRSVSMDSHSVYKDDCVKSCVGHSNLIPAGEW